MASTQRRVQVEKQIVRLAAKFIERESNRQSLITITRADISPDFKNAVVYFTVLPENREEQALGFAKRGRGDFRNFAKKHTRLKTLPRFDFEIDEGEKHRQRIDNVSRHT